MHDGCVLCGGTGVGKSHTAVEYYLRNHVPKTVYVITSAKKRDSQDWQFLFGDVGMTSNPEVTPGELVYVDSWENIKKYEEVKDAFFIFDEQRLVGSGRWVKAFYKIAAANKWIMLSATPGDNWLDYVPLFRANGFIKNLTQFKEDHVISRWTGRYYQVQGYRQVGKLVRWRNQLLVDMPYEKHTTRHTHEVAVEYDKDLVRELVNKRWHVYENRPLTDASELFRVMRKVVYSDSSRLTAVRDLLRSHPKLIVFYSYNYELEMLRTLNIPPTQIMKMPDGIFQMGPSHIHAPATQDQEGVESVSPSGVSDSAPSNSKVSLGPETPRSNSTTSTPNCGDEQTQSIRTESKSSTNEALLSPTTTGRPSTTELETDGSEPWDYLLSPAGMSLNAHMSLIQKAANASVSLEETSRESSQESLETRGSDSPTSSGTALSGFSESSGPTRESEETASSAETSRTTQRLSEASTTTAVPAIQRTPRATSALLSPADSTVGSGSPAPSTRSGESLETNQNQNGSTSAPSPGTPSSCTRQPNTAQCAGNHDPSSQRSIVTPPSTTDQISSSGSSQNSEDCSAKQRTDQETECQTANDSTQTRSSTTTTTAKASKSSVTPRSGTSGERSTSPNEDSPKTSTTKRSSEPSRRSPDLSGPGSDSTSSPQFQVAEWNGHKHEAVPTTTSWVYLVQYVAGAEAWECIETDAMCFFSMPYSYKLWWQAYGRIDRLNTPFNDLHYYVLYGDSPLEKGVAKALETKKSFNESAFAAEIGW